MSNSPISGNLPHPLGVKTAALSCMPSAHDGVWLQNLVSDVKDPPSIKPLMARLLTPISLVSKLGEYRACRLAECSPTIQLRKSQMEMMS